MKSKIALLTMVFCLALGTLACAAIQNVSTNRSFVQGSGNVSTETRPVSGIHSVSLQNQGDLTIEVGDSESLVVEAEDDLLPYIQTEVVSGELVIRTKSNTELRNKQPIRYHLTAKQLDGLRITSSGNITAPELHAQDFSINVSSSGNMSVAALYADHLAVRITSSGNVEINGGQVPVVDVQISSSGEFNAENMAVQSATVRISSSGNATLRVSDQLLGTISSSGNVYYFGNPQVRVSTSSSGEAIKSGD